MGFDVRLHGGPYDGTTLTIKKNLESLGLGIDDNGKPDQRKPPIGLAFYRNVGSADNALSYEFCACQRCNGQPYPIEFVGGPAAGQRPGECPARFMPEKQIVPLLQEGTLFRGDGEIGGAAIYERRQDGESWTFHFVGIDTTPELLTELMDDANNWRVGQAMKSFYESPDYSLYSKKPTDDHAQVFVERGYRRAHVDELLGPLIQALWDLDMDTFGSCQKLHSRPDATDDAYVSFPRASDGRRFEKILKDAGIVCVSKLKPMTIGRRNDDGTQGEQITVEATNVRFASADVERIANVVRAQSRG